MGSGEATAKNIHHTNPCQAAKLQPAKKKRNLPGTPDPEAEVVALSPKSLLATNRYVCEICGKGFQRDQNLQLHRRGHNLPWKLRQRSGKETRKRVYVCPEKSCVHHNPSRALGDLTGIKKHFCRKHGEKRWKCDKCSKRYAVRSDWKAHSRTCGSRDFRCDCGTLFSRRDAFITHRAFCDALAVESARVSRTSSPSTGEATHHQINGDFVKPTMARNDHHLSPILMKPAAAAVSMADGELVSQGRAASNLSLGNMGRESQYNHEDIGYNNGIHHSGVVFSLPSNPIQLECDDLTWTCGTKIPFSNTNDRLTSTTLPSWNDAVLPSVPSLYSSQSQPHSRPVVDTSATALLQKAAQIGVTTSADPSQAFDLSMFNSNPEQQVATTTAFQNKTRDFLGVGFPTPFLPSIHRWI